MSADQGWVLFFFCFEIADIDFVFRTASSKIRMLLNLIYKARLLICVCVCLTSRLQQQVALEFPVISPPPPPPPPVVRRPAYMIHRRRRAK